MISFRAQGLECSLLRRFVRAAVLVVLLLFASFQSAPAHAVERITDLDVAVTVNADGTLRIIERIAVVAEGRQIRHGIYRDFPTQFRNRVGVVVSVPFEVQSVMRDGKPEHWFISRLSNGVRIYAGREGALVEPGNHVYEFVYTTDRQIGFFAQGDELYRNVTGNAWLFPIEQVHVSVSLPKSVPMNDVSAEAWTGKFGEHGTDFEALANAHSGPAFRTTRALAPGEGLTIAVGFPKGYVREPDLVQRLRWLIEDNWALSIGVVGALVLLVFYIIVWWRLGRDPERGVRVPRATPPGDMSPAAVRFVLYRMNYDATVFVTALIRMAVQGWIHISEGAGDYMLSHTAGTGPLAPDERRLLVELLPAEGDSMPLTRRYEDEIRSAMFAHMGALREAYENRYLAHNGRSVAVGSALSFAVLAAVVHETPTLWNHMALIANGVTLIFGSILLLFFIFPAIEVIDWFAGRPANIVRAVACAGVGAVMSLFVAFAAGLLGLHADVTPGAIGCVLFGINVVFNELMKAPTVAGRRVLDEIGGLREYLSTTDTDAIKHAPAPRQSPEHFESMLPYAIAVGVEHQWSVRFSKILGDAVRSGVYRRPRWYTGMHWNTRHMGGFATAIGGTLSQATSAAASPPGSSRGSGGGGSSGGGGGGGGDGGW